MKELTDKKLQQLKSVIAMLADIPEVEWAYFSEQIKGRIFNTYELFIQAGEPVTDFYFINKGLVRFYYLTEDGKEFNKAFAMENDFVGSFSAKNQNIPSRFSVQALEKTKALVIPVRIIEEGYNRHPCWERLGRLHAERVAVMKEMREAEFLLDSAETRYTRLLSSSPAILERVNQYHIASYLGITDVALSRIRKKIGLTGGNTKNS